MLLNDQISLIDKAIDEYLASLAIRETKEARENLETAQKELRKLKNKNTEEDQKKKNEEQNRKDEESKSDTANRTEP